MAVALKVFVDPKAPGARQLTTELERQLSALQAGELEAEKKAPPPGTLAVPDPDTVLLVLKVAVLSLKIIRAVIAIVRDARERHAASKHVPLDQVPPVFLFPAVPVVGYLSYGPDLTQRDNLILPGDLLAEEIASVQGRISERLANPIQRLHLGVRGGLVLVTKEASGTEIDDHLTATLWVQGQPGLYGDWLRVSICVGCREQLMCITPAAGRVGGDIKTP